MEKNNQKIAAGIDIGSRTIKLVLYDGEKVIHSDIIQNTYNTIDICQSILNPIHYDSIVATGYGRYLMELSLNSISVSEIKAFAVGCIEEFPGKKTIIDIGGQDTKIIIVNEQEKIIKFEMNDRCAAGTGKFIEIMAKTLNYSLDDFGSLPQTNKDNLVINNMCTVFAESEVITMLNRGVKRDSISYALHESIVKRIIPIVKKIHDRGHFIFCGGCANNKLLRQLLEKELEHPIGIPKNPQLVGALGASILAHQMIKNK